MIARCVAEDTLFPDWDSSRVFWNRFGSLAQEHEVSIGHICLMRTHYHLLVRAQPEALAKLLQLTHGKLAWHRNRDGQRRGTLFGRRYDVIPIESARHLLSVARYIPLNPVKAKAVADPRGWHWSTHRFLAGHVRPPDWYDVKAALRMVSFFDSRSYERWVLSETPLELPPMTQRELMDFRICELADYGMGKEEIAAVLHLGARRVRNVIGASALRSVAA